MCEIFWKILDSQGYILADGATGTNLFNVGLESGEAPEIWNNSFPEKIKDLYRQSVLAGSDLFLTNSFGGNASRLALHGASDRAYELSKLSAQLGLEVKSEFERDVIMAGSVGPSGDLMIPLGDLSFSRAVEIFVDQIRGLVDGGVDLIWIETMSAIDEFKAAAEAASIVGIPWIGTMSFDTAGRTMMGIKSSDLVKEIETLPNAPLAYGANCGVGASDLLRTVLGFNSAGASLPLVAKGNAGIPKFIDGEIHYDGSPELMAKYAVMSLGCGAKVIGGCCGTTPKHLVAMKSALQNCHKLDTPSLRDIQREIGPFSSDSDGTDNKAIGKRSRRTRRKVCC